MSQRAVAAAAGLNHQTLYRIEQSRVWPTASTIVRLAGALDVDPEELVVALLRGWFIKQGLTRTEAAP
jgi:transcriptional regulator with XRE-family HTH domain